MKLNNRIVDNRMNRRKTDGSEAKRGGGSTAQRRVLSRSLLCKSNASVYHFAMIMQNAQEPSDALQTSGDSELDVVDPQTQRRYVLIDSETHRRAMDALRREQDREAIAEGLAHLEAEEGQRSNSAFVEQRSRLGFPEPG